jgi:hypothetical protein
MPTTRTRIGCSAAIVLALIVVGASTAGATARTAVETVPCSEITGYGQGASLPDRLTALGAVRVGQWSTATGSPAQTGSGWAWWVKVGIDIRPNAGLVRVTVPLTWRSRAAVVWGYGNTESAASSIQFASCPRGGALRWNEYAGGLYLRADVACVPLVFSVDGKHKTRSVGVGTSCRR